MPIKRKNGAGLQIKKKYYRLKAKISLPFNLDASLALKQQLEKPEEVQEKKPTLYCEDSEYEECIDAYVDEEEEKSLKLRIDSIALRYSIMVLFVNKYKALDNIEDGKDIQSGWNGRNGLIPKIKSDLGLKLSSSVKILPIFMEIVECARTGKVFDATNLENRKGHKPVIIMIDSIEAQVVADCLEGGLSVERSRQMLNEHMLENNKEGYTRSAVDSLVLRMNPRIEKITKRKQGSRDPNNPWSQARLLWSKQLLIRFGELPSEENEPRFNQSIAGKLDLDQVVWWDETHRKCLIGGLTTSRNFSMKFRRDENGKLNHKIGEYSKKKIQILNCKYEKECRFGLGCAMVTPKTFDGEYLPPKGRRCEPYDYSGKLLLSLTDYENKMSAEFRRVKSLSNRVGYWVQGTREEDKLYLDDLLSKLKKVGKVTSKKMSDNGFICVADMKKIVDPDSISVDGISKAAMKNIWEQTQQAIDSNVPPSKDHRLEENPYLSKFGDDWEVYLRKSSAFSSSIVITEYIKHMMEASAKVMKGTKHENDWVVYHDALSIMTAAPTKKWMVDNDYMKRWILPSDDLY